MLFLCLQKKTPKTQGSHNRTVVRSAFKMLRLPNRVKDGVPTCTCQLDRGEGLCKGWTTWMRQLGRWSWNQWVGLHIPHPVGHGVDWVGCGLQ